MHHRTSPLSSAFHFFPSRTRAFYSTRSRWSFQEERIAPRAQNATPTGFALQQNLCATCATARFLTRNILAHRGLSSATQAVDSYPQAISGKRKDIFSPNLIIAASRQKTKRDPLLNETTSVGGKSRA
jgi:hypothetical protein